MKRLNTHNRGFSLIEMIVSIAIFSFVMLAVMTVLLSVIDADHKAQGLKSAMNNIGLTLESMSRNVRTGTTYVLGGIVNTSACPAPGGTSLTFRDHGGVTTVYSRTVDASGVGSISVSKAGGAFQPMVAPEINIDRLCFYAAGTPTSDTLQPKILVTVGGVVTGVAAVKVRTSSRFDIQTLISQRSLDVRQN